MKLWDLTLAAASALLLAALLALTPRPGDIHITEADWRWADAACVGHGGVHHLLKDARGEQRVTAICEDGREVR